jgi:hypothetical protein
MTRWWARKEKVEKGAEKEERHKGAQKCGLLSSFSNNCPKQAITQWAKTPDYQLVRLYCALVDADGAPAAVVGFELGLVVDEAALLEHDVPVLPAVDVIRPFAQGA